MLGNISNTNCYNYNQKINFINNKSFLAGLTLTYSLVLGSNLSLINFENYKQKTTSSLIEMTKTNKNPTLSIVTGSNFCPIDFIDLIQEISSYMRYMSNEEMEAFNEDCINFFKNGEILEIELSSFDEIELI